MENTKIAEELAAMRERLSGVLLSKEYRTLLDLENKLKGEGVIEGNTNKRPVSEAS